MKNSILVALIALATIAAPDSAVAANQAKRYIVAGDLCDPADESFKFFFHRKDENETYVPCCVRLEESEFHIWDYCPMPSGAKLAARGK